MCRRRRLAEGSRLEGRVAFGLSFQEAERATRYFAKATRQGSDAAIFARIQCLHFYAV